jgi:predicted transcriptional regulator
LTPSPTLTDPLQGLLGPRESQVMEIIWQRGPSLVSDVHIGLRQACHYKTVLTICTRLTAKGLLEPTRENRAYRFAPTQSRAEFAASEVVASQTSRDVRDLSRGLRRRDAGDEEHPGTDRAREGLPKKDQVTTGSATSSQRGGPGGPTGSGR